MLFGVTYSAFLINAVVVLEAFIVTRNLLWLLAALPIHGIFVLLCMYEPRFFDLLVSWVRTCLTSGWGPFALDPPDAKGRRKAKTSEVVL